MEAEKKPGGAHPAPALREQGREPLNATTTESTRKGPSKKSGSSGGRAKVRKQKGGRGKAGGL